jgi:predicted kinase
MDELLTAMVSTAKLIAMCGLSFSGKTTLAKGIARFLGAEYVSLDDINEERGLRGGDGIPNEEWELTSTIAIERIGILLDAGRDVILDDTLCFRWLRERYAAVAMRHAAQFLLVYISVPLAEIDRARRNNESTAVRHSILPEVFEQHARSFEHPTDDEQPLIYDRTVPAEVWVSASFLQEC